MGLAGITLQTSTLIVFVLLCGICTRVSILALDRLAGAAMIAPSHILGALYGTSK